MCLIRQFIFSFQANHRPVWDLKLAASISIIIISCSICGVHTLSVSQCMHIYLADTFWLWCNNPALWFGGVINCLFRSSDQGVDSKSGWQVSVVYFISGVLVNSTGKNFYQKVNLFNINWLSHKIYMFWSFHCLIAYRCSRPTFEFLRKVLSPPFVIFWSLLIENVSGYHACLVFHMYEEDNI